MSKKVVITQPRYLPTISYLRRIAKADTLIIYDNVQRVSRGFEHRNKMLDPKGNEQWLSIPIASSSRELIKDTIIASDVTQSGQKWTTWHREHMNKIYEWYKKVDADYFITMDMAGENYRDVLVSSLEYLFKKYNINTEIILSSKISSVTNGGIGELIGLVNKVGGTTYVSGKTCLEYGLTHSVASTYGLELEIDEWLPDVEKPYLPYLHHELIEGEEFVNKLILA
jgi:WbqC-like protein family